MARPTLVALAQELGVSRQTVSNAINAPERVSPATLARVRAAIEASGYRPNASARALRRQRANTLAMRIHSQGNGINDAVMDRFLHHLVGACRSRGYHLTLITAGDDADEVSQLLDLFGRGTADACFIFDTHPGDLRPHDLGRMPVAAFGRPWGREETDDHLWVDVDGAAGIALATRHLMAQGHERIGFIGWTDRQIAIDRRTGWRETMAAERSSLPWQDWEVITENTVSDGAAAMEDLIQREVTAVVCATDSLAVGAAGVMRRDRGLGFQAPLPLIGFDDTPVAAALGISSLTQPVDRAAELLARHLIDDLEAKEHLPAAQRLPREQRLLVPSLTVR